MSGVVDRRAHAVVSTSDVPAEQAVAYWRELISTTFVRLTAEPTTRRAFLGRIEYVPCGDIGLSTVTADSQVVRRTRPLIGQDDADYLLASVLLDGSASVEQDGRTAVLTTGTMAFYDSSRPYSLQSGGRCTQLVVQVPRRQIAVRDTRRLTARTLGPGTPGGVVAPFLGSLRDGAARDAAQTAALVPHAVGLLSALAAFAADSEPADGAASALARQRVTDFLHRNLAEPQLDAQAVANACNLSRRALYRLVGREGVAGRLRRIRIERAEDLLVHDPGRPVGSVAAACGFESESGFHRAFREATGRTPGEFRRHVREGVTHQPDAGTTGLG